LWSELGNQIYLYLSSVTLANVVDNRVLGTSGINLFPVNNVGDTDMLVLQNPELRSVE
jgi:Rrf2 family iron-sulfur cluster assembly transcriptional regulator